MGAWFPEQGRVVFRGKNLFTELQHMSWPAMWYFAITGKTFTDSQIELFSRLWVICTSYPEPRIWNNRVAALTGSAKSTAMLALASGVGVSEGKIYGGQANIRAMDFIIRAKQSVVDEGQDLEVFVKSELERTRAVPYGYGRPVHKTDERAPEALKLAESLGLHDGHHVRISYEIEEILLKMRYRARINIGGLTAALFADQGVTPKEFYTACGIIYSAGMMACYVDTAEKPAGSFFPFRCEIVDYSGPGKRAW